MGDLMTKLRSTILFCATILTVFVLALMVGALNYGSVSGHLISHGSTPPPDETPLVAHGSTPPPDETPLVAHGSTPPPDETPLMAHGSTPPPDETYLA